MLFSFKEFQQTKANLISEFQQQPQLSIQYQNLSTLSHEYNKLLNCIRFANNEKHQARLNGRMLAKNNLGECRSTRVGVAREDLGRLGTGRDLRGFVKDRGMTIRVRDAGGEGGLGVEAGDERKGVEEDGIYLTAVFNKKQPQELIVNETPAKLTSVNPVQRVQTLEFQPICYSQPPQQQASPEYQNLFNLKLKIFQLTKDDKYLHNQISQLQQSIRYYKRQSNLIQNQMSNKDKTQTIALNCMLKKQSDLNTVDSRNRNFQEKCHSTERFFAKSLKSIKISKNSGSRKCADLVEETAEKMLTAKFFRERVQGQRDEMRRLDDKIRYKQQRIQEAKQMQKYAEMFLRLKSLSSFIKNSQYGDTEGLAQINKSLEQSLTLQKSKSNLSNSSRIGTSKNLSQSNPSIEPQPQNQTPNFILLAKQILTTYRRLTKDQSILKQNYEYKMLQLQNSRKTFMAHLLELSQFCASDGIEGHREVHGVGDWERGRFTGVVAEGFVGGDSGKIGKSQLSVSLAEMVEFGQVLEKRGQKIIKLSQTLIAMEQRAKFFIKKQLKYLQSIVEKWLKYDQSAMIFVLQSVNSLVKIQPESFQPISYGLSQKILSQYFQNWSNYMFFIQNLHNNPILHNSLTRQRLEQALRRVIKTKLQYPEVRTQRILTKCLKQMFRENISRVLRKIKSYLRLGVDISQYASKYQVLIVNSADACPEPQQQLHKDQIDQNADSAKSRKPTQANVQNPRSSEQNTNSYITNLQRVSNSSKQDRNSRPHRIYAKFTHESQASSQTDQLNTDPNWKQDQRDEIAQAKQFDKQIQVENNQQESHAIVNYVLAYQEYINSLSKLVKVNK